MKSRSEMIGCHANKNWLAAATMMVFLSGCMVGPDYQRTQVQTPAVFRASPAPTVPNAESIANLKWFEVFKDEQLQDLIRTALARTTTFEMRSLESMRRALILGSRRQISIQTSASGVDLPLWSRRRRDNLAFPAEAPNANETTEQFSSISLHSRSIFGAGCAGRPSRRARSCWPRIRTARRLSQPWSAT